MTHALGIIIVNVPLNPAYLGISIIERILRVIAGKTMAITTKELQCALPKRHYRTQVILDPTDLSVGDKPLR